jgi:hypothetical protein
MPVVIDNNKFPYTVKISWRLGDDVNRWDKICADCVESYGLPGDKFITSVSAENMSFYFKDEKDALWFRLKSE